MIEKKDVHNEIIGSAIVVGGGIGGMQAALDLAEVGIKVYLVEAASAIGGRMVQLDKTFPTNECAMCVVSPKLVECERHLNIEVIPDTEIERIEGEAGSFEVTLYKRARFVDMEKCTGCDECTKVCPVEVPSSFDAKIGNHKAIYRMYPQAVPHTFVIDKSKKAPCVIKCPAHINVQGYLALISQGKYKEAFDLIRHSAPFPGVLGRVCYHPCEEECNRKEIEEPVAINPLKRFVSDFVYKNKKSNLFTSEEKEKENIKSENGKRVRDRPYSFDSDITKELVEQRKGKKVAVVGAGPAGLTCASDLIRLGYKAVVYEKLSKPGGMLLTGIPDYRLPKKILEIEIQHLIDLGVEIRTNSPIGKELTLSDLQKEYQAVFIAIGAHLSRKLEVPGEDMEGVVHGVDFLREFNLNGKANVGKKVVIIGGGNVAVDSARTALRLGAEEVTILYRRSRDEIPASLWEIEEAEKEGVKFHFLAAPTKILGKNNKVTGMECIRMELGEPDASGRRRPVSIKGSEFEIEADLIIPAIGQSPDLSWLGDNLNKTGWGTIQVNPLTFATSSSGIFAGGDVSSGPASVIEAIAAGKEAAISIDRYIRGENLERGRRLKEEPAPVPEMEFKKQQRAKVSLLPPKERKGNFKEVELTLNEEEAVREAKRCMNCGICSECLECEKVCEPFAIEPYMKDERLKIKAGAIIIALGVRLFDANLKKEYGFDRYDNVITSMQFERILSSSGPTQGEVLRPSDGKHPKRIAFIQCVGSRDPSCGNEFCSSVCCMYSIKEAVIAKEHDPEIKPTVFYIDIRSFGKDFDRYYENAKKNYGVNFIRCMISKVYEKPKSKNLMVKYIDEAGQMQEAEFDLVTLAVGMTDTTKSKALAKKLDIETNEYGFADTKRDAPGLTTKEGIYVTGILAEPKDIPETVAEGSSAACLVSALLKDSRGTLIKKKEYLPERDVLDEDVRIGVFVCRCGRNIGAVVNVPEVVEYASKLEGVAYAAEFLYSCSKDSLDEIKKKVVEHNLNRVVVAACTPRTHEELFRDTVREAGLNRYLFEMTSIREQVSWVHKDIPEEATQKSKEMVNMMVAKARLIKPLERKFSDVTPKALVIGGGTAGMQSALYTARQGFEVYLIEKEDSLGGHLREIFYNLDDTNPQELLKTLTKEIHNNKNIHVMTNARVKSISGFIGNYNSVINCKGEEKEIEHGIVIVATGAKPYEPKTEEYGWGQSPKIITQVNLEERLAKNPGDFSKPQTFVMIQCVGSRNDEHPYCSRVCCAHAIKNGLKLKSINPEHKIIVLYRDIRTYGFLEKHYLKAREEGIVFFYFDKEKEPQVVVENNEISIKHNDKLLREELSFKPDWLILSTGIAPGDNDELTKALKIPLNQDGFFLEAHAKIRPLDFTTEGMFFCGLAHSPKLLHESITQAQGASVRAVTILSKDKIEAKAITVTVNERICKGCELCISVCPYDAREIDEETSTARVIEALCQGCGACAVVCPSGATRHKGFSKKQILTMVEHGV